MNTEIKVDEWKSGTEALGLCMICGGEYEASRRECPDCHVSLSVVRRCPKCKRIVSAQHTKCVYCRTPFTEELPKRPFGDEEQPIGSPRPSKGEKRFRALAVSISTFVVVFALGVIFLHQVHRISAPIQVIAKSYLLRPVDLRHAPSMGSSIVDKLAAGTNVNLTGYLRGDQGQGWMAVAWKKGVAYVPANELAAPKALDTDEGAKALMFYLNGMATGEDVGDAVKAVDYYVKAFPGDVNGEELRWVLAERIRFLSQQGGPGEAALRQQAEQQYGQLEASKGRFAEKAHEALARHPSASGTQLSRPRPSREADRSKVVSEIIGGQTSSADVTAHEVLILNQARVIVQLGTHSRLTVGTVISGRVAHSVKTNGIVAIPAGAPCQLVVVNTGSSEADVSLGLTSIEVDHRAYAVKSSTVETHSDKGTVDRALAFHLNAPLVIQR